MGVYDFQWNMEANASTPWDFTSVTDANGSITRTAGAAHDGQFGLHVVTTDAVDHYVSKTTNQTIGAWAEFWLRISSDFTLTAVGVLLMSARNAGGRVFDFYLDGPTGSDALVRLFRDQPAGLNVGSGQAMVLNTWYKIKIGGTGFGTANGAVYLYMNDVLKVSETGLDWTAVANVTEWRLGATGHFGAGTRTGSLDYDTGWIDADGQVSVGPPPDIVAVSPCTIKQFGSSAMGLTALSDPIVSGVVIALGDNWQTVTTANPAGTTFSIAPGTHTGQQVRPKAGNTYIASAPGVIMDGQSTKTFAFGLSAAASPNSVTIDGFEIKNYIPSGTRGAINCGQDSAAAAGSGWNIRNCYIHDCTDHGIRIGHNMTVSDTTVARCQILGIAGVGDNVVVERSSFYSCNTHGGVADAGGSKFVLTNGLIVRDCSFTSNNGPGLWLDIGNNGFLLERNTVSANSQEGIVIEISYGGIIQNNICRYNGMTDNRADNYLWGAGIGIHASGGTGLTISNNTLEGNAYAISLIEQQRGTNYADPAGVDPIMIIQNVTVDSNTITMQSVSGFLYTKSIGGTQAAADYLPNTLSGGTRNITFTRNRYTLNSCTTAFAWAGAYRSASYWTGTAHFDTAGTFTP